MTDMSGTALGLQASLKNRPAVPRQGMSGSKAPAPGRVNARPQTNPHASPGTRKAVSSATALERATASWKALRSNFAIAGKPGAYAKEPGQKHRAEVWQFGQAIAAALDMAKLTKNYQPAKQMFAQLGSYYKNPAKPGYLPSPSSKTQWYDDNGWIGLDLMKAYKQTGDKSYLHQAEGLFNFIKTGQQKGGGMIWDDTAKKNDYNMPATACTSQMALELYNATQDPQYLAFAQQNIDFMNTHLLAQKGPHKDLYWEGVKVEGKKWTPWAYGKPAKLNSYNQGTGFMCNLMLGQILEKQGKTAQAAPYLNQAKQTVHASLAHFQGETLWKDQAAFNGIYFRNLMLYADANPNPQYQKAMENYLNEAWTKGRNAKGDFGKGGIGLFHGVAGHGDLLDQGALVQLYALDALDKGAGKKSKGQNTGHKG